MHEYWTADKIPWCLSQRYAVVCVHVHKNKWKLPHKNSSPDGNKIMIFSAHYIPLPQNTSVSYSNSFIPHFQMIAYTTAGSIENHEAITKKLMKERSLPTSCIGSKFTGMSAHPGANFALSLRSIAEVRVFV